MVATTFIARAAVLFAAARIASAAGSAVVKNQCDFEVYLWSVSESSGTMRTLSSNGGEYTEAYQTNPDGGGISLKVGRDQDGTNITQYEYTLEGESLWYDLSLINGHPFVEYGVSVVPSEESCKAVICPAGIELCAAAYMIPTDNWATGECTSDSDTVLILCSGDEDTTGSSSVTAVASSAVKTASTVTVFPSTTAVVKASTTEEAASTTVKSSASEASSTAKIFSWVHTEKATTTAAAQTAASNPNVIVHTTFVTYVVTVEERDAAPTPAPVAKRQIHRHEHGQQKRHEHIHQE